MDTASGAPTATSTSPSAAPPTCRFDKPLLRPSMRRSGHPSRPSASACCRFLPTQDIAHPVAVLSGWRRRQYLARGLQLAEFHPSPTGRFWVSTEDRRRRPIQVPSTDKLARPAPPPGSIRVASLASGRNHRKHQRPRCGRTPDGRTTLARSVSSRSMAPVLHAVSDDLRHSLAETEIRVLWVRYSRINPTGDVFRQTIRMEYDALLS